LHNEEYCRRVIPHLKSAYFSDEFKSVYRLIKEYIDKYNKPPTSQALIIDADNVSYINEANYDEAIILIKTLKENPKVKLEWLLDQTEKMCQEKAIHLSILESIDILDGKREDVNKNIIPDLLKDALAVSFDSSVGHDYTVDADKRYDFYHSSEEHIPFDLDKLNAITKGGLVNKSLNVFMGGTGTGKSLVMCHIAASMLMQAKNVLYITLEMSEERIAERIDANLLNIPIDQLENINKDMFNNKVNTLISKTSGKLIIKEYPTASANVNHFRALLNELHLKKNFKPDIIFIDYINICASARMRGLGGSINSYGLVKAIAEELRGLAVEFNLPIVSATQVNREGYGNSDAEITNVSESFGLPATCDLMLALISNEELEDLNQLMIKQLKNRYNDTSQNRKFLVGIDRSKMKLYDLEDSAQTLIQSTSTSNKEVADYSDFKV